MGSASAPVVGGRVNPSNIPGSARSVFWASAGVALFLFVVGLGVMMYNAGRSLIPVSTPRVDVPGVGGGRDGAPSGLERYA